MTNATTATTTTTNPPILPANNPLLPFWRTDLDPLDNLRTTPSLPQQSDIVIIGAGYAGVTLAYHLLKQQDESQPQPHHPTITLLEARQVCSGATGRNGLISSQNITLPPSTLNLVCGTNIPALNLGGHLRPDIYGNIPTYIERHGLEAGVEVADFEWDHIQALRDLLREEEIDCEFNLTRNMNVYFDEQAGEKAKSTLDMLVAQGVKLAKELHFTTGERAERISGVKGTKACISYTSGTLWPYKFILGLLSKIADSPALNVQTQTPVTSVTTAEETTETHTIHTPRGTIRAGKVIYATNAYTAGLLPEYSANIVPCRGICCHIALPEGKTAPFLPYSYALGTKKGLSGGSYLISRSDGSIIVGGASHTFKSAREEWYNVVDDTTLIETAKDYYNDYMQRTFIGWEDSGAYVKEIWTGIMGYSYDTSPHIGDVPNRPGQYVCAGFNGHGMPVILLAARELADMVRTGKSFEDTKMPRLFKTSAERIQRARSGPEGGDIFA
ncbi:FAD dependent oxidoreductase [Aspergillus heteromorphus CBS 117.55]|uniref:FAD dependent oxidoreductase n=1 Tax=Aspergillus heteromorphus CBS 117.55 TaxID=1448321 RepID=A0A317VB16_9EURO|nr:FAD dependent oxidoreductase [Aspergillus heteromorphus CBS 117.55]PWY70267.1 FAD dependent oxidoreductase [Aspergillus heteromorphus CBS 117.55]